MCRKDITFGEAIEAVRKGHRAARAGWNGKGMFIYLTRGNVAPAVDEAKPASLEGIPYTSGHFAVGDRDTVTRLPHICMRAASGATVTGWLASQTDMLACDWEILK
jgi:hypothetical protein